MCVVVKCFDLLFCDELIGVFDFQIGILVFEVFVNINRELGMIMVVIIYNVAIAKMVDRVIYFSDGCVARIERNDKCVDPRELSW